MIPAAAAARTRIGPGTLAGAAGCGLTGVLVLWSNRPMTRTLAFLAALVAGLAFVAVAGAKTIDDPDDTNGRIDIKSAKFSRTDSGKFRFVVRFFEKVPANGETGNEYLEIWKSKPHVAEGCGGCFKELPYKMQGPQTGKQDVFKAGGEGSSYKKTGSGRIKRDGRTLTFTLPPKAVGKPKLKFFWRITSYYYGPEEQCPMGPCEDHAPDGSKLVKQPL
jgi:hypothetical protein